MDPIVIQIPKGSYIITFGFRARAAAAEFVCRPHRVEELRRRLMEEATGGDFPPFEALIHIQLYKGAVTEMSLVTVRRRDDLLQAAQTQPKQLFL